MTYSRPWMYIGLALMAAGLVLLFQQGELESRGLGRASGQRRCREVRLLPEGTAAAPSSAKTGDPAAQQSKPDPYQWKSLFDGKIARRLEDARLRRRGQGLRQGRHDRHRDGQPMTGITWTGDVLRNNYEIRTGGHAAGRQRFLLHHHLSRRQRPLLAGRRRLGRHGGRSVEHRFLRRLGQRHDQDARLSRTNSGIASASA